MRLFGSVFQLEVSSVITFPVWKAATIGQQASQTSNSGQLCLPDTLQHGCNFAEISRSGFTSTSGRFWEVRAYLLVLVQEKTPTKDWSPYLLVLGIFGWIVQVFRYKNCIWTLTEEQAVKPPYRGSFVVVFSSANLVLCWLELACELTWSEVSGRTWAQAVIFFGLRPRGVNKEHSVWILQAISLVPDTTCSN